MSRRREARVQDQGDGTWCVLLGDAPIRSGLSRAEAEEWATKTPSELVKGTQWSRQWFSRGVSAERIAAIRAEDVCDPIRSGEYVLDLFDLYHRMWEIGQDERDGTRLFRPRPGTREALKWLIEDLSGTPADPVKTMPDNNNIRRAVHARLQERGWADRINQVSFRLLRDPAVQVLPEEPSLEELSRTHSAGQPQDLAWNTDLSTQPPESDELLSEDGELIVDVTTSEITGANGAPRLGGLRWSDWHPLDVAAREATTDPGVYIARSGSQVVYVGMAGERRGMGVRGRLQIYARGRGAVSGLGEAALDRALADQAWLSDRLHRLHPEGPSRAKQWAADAMEHAHLHICWTSAPTAEAARETETAVLLELEDVALWNRARPHRP